MYFDLVHPRNIAPDCGEGTVAQFWAFALYRKYYTTQRQPCLLTELGCTNFYV